MVMIALCSSLIGAVLGTRFKVMVLLPAITIGVTLVAAIAVLRGSALSTAIGAAVMVGVFLQLGYLGGLLTRLSLTPAQPASQRSLHSTIARS